MVVCKAETVSVLDSFCRPLQPYVSYGGRPFRIAWRSVPGVDLERGLALVSSVSLVKIQDRNPSMEGVVAFAAPETHRWGSDEGADLDGRGVGEWGAPLVRSRVIGSSFGDNLEIARGGED
jgi:hypothetical protein